MPPDTELADDGEDQILGGNVAGERSFDRHRERARLALQQALRREHVRDLGAADAEGEGAERAVRTRVAVAADDGLAGLRQPELGADHVDDAALSVPQAEQLHAEGGAVLFQLTHLARRGIDRDRCSAEDLRGLRGGRVVHRRERALRPPHGEFPLTQHRERLRRCDLMHQVQVDVQYRGRGRALGAHLVPLPDLFEEGLRSTRHQPDAATRGVDMST